MEMFSASSSLAKLQINELPMLDDRTHIIIPIPIQGSENYFVCIHNFVKVVKCEIMTLTKISGFVNTHQCALGNINPSVIQLPVFRHLPIVRVPMDKIINILINQEEEFVNLLNFESKIRRNEASVRYIESEEIMTNGILHSTKLQDDLYAIIDQDGRLKKGNNFSFTYLKTRPVIVIGNAPPCLRHLRGSIEYIDSKQERYNDGTVWAYYINPGCIVSVNYIVLSNITMDNKSKHLPSLTELKIPKIMLISCLKAGALYADPLSKDIEFNITGQITEDHDGNYIIPFNSYFKCENLVFSDDSVRTIRIVTPEKDKPIPQAFPITADEYMNETIIWGGNDKTVQAEIINNYERNPKSEYENNNNAFTKSPAQVGIVEIMIEELRKGSMFVSELRRNVSSKLHKQLTNSDLNRVLFNRKEYFTQNGDGSWKLNYK